MDEERKKWVTAFCWAGFVITSGAGLGLFLVPNFISDLLIVSGAEPSNPFFVRLLGLVLVAVGVCYFMALYDEDALRSLIFVASGEKVLAVLYCFGVFIAGKVSPMIWGVIVVDGILAGIGIYLSISLSRILWTDDNMETGQK